MVFIPHGCQDLKTGRRRPFGCHVYVQGRLLGHHQLAGFEFIFLVGHLIESILRTVIDLDRDLGRLRL